MASLIYITLSMILIKNSHHFLGFNFLEYCLQEGFRLGKGIAIEPNPRMRGENLPKKSNNI
jgi:hypothetical protein